MALDKLVDSAQLDEDLTSVADAIREKGGTSADLLFPSGFITAIGEISGGLDWDSAIIHIYAPASSTVTAQKSGGTAVTLKEHTVSGADSEYIHIVKKADYDTYTITATLNEQTSSETISVNANIEYIVNIAYGLYIVKDGLILEPYNFNARLRSVSASITNAQESGYYEISCNSTVLSGAAYGTTIDFSQYTTLTCVLDAVNFTTSKKGWIGVTKAINASSASSLESNFLAHEEISADGSNLTVNVDLTGINNSNYIGFAFVFSSGTHTGEYHIKELKLI